MKTRIPNMVRLAWLPLTSIMLLFVVCGLVGFRYASEVKQQQPKTITLVVTTDEFNTLMKGVSKLPLEESANLYFNLQGQAQRQLQPAQPVDTSKKGGKKQ